MVLGIYIKLCRFCIKFVLIEGVRNLVEKLYGWFWVFYLVFSFIYFVIVSKLLNVFWFYFFIGERKGLSILFFKFFFSFIKFYLSIFKLMIFFRKIYFMFIILFFFFEFY